MQFREISRNIEKLFCLDKHIRKLCFIRIQKNSKVVNWCILPEHVNKIQMICCNHDEKKGVYSERKYQKIL